MAQNRRIPLAILLSLGLAVIAGLVFGQTAPAVAQAPDAALEEEMYRIADKLNCPICQGQRLSECPIQICQEMREEITLRLQDGQSEAEIIQAFVDRYGVQALNQPPIEGFNLLAWVMPFVGLAVVLVVGGWVLRQWSRRRPTAPTAAAEETAAGDLPEEYLRRLEEELTR